MLGTQNRLLWPVVSSDFWRDVHALNGSGDSGGTPQWTPPAIVAESDAEYTLRLEVPGVTAESIEVDLDGEYLSVAGERPAPVSDGSEKVLVSEVPMGRFHRRFRLGSEAERDAIAATHRDGLLVITVPKRQEARPRRIPVSTEA